MSFSNSNFPFTMYKLNQNNNLLDFYAKRDVFGDIVGQKAYI